MQVHHSNHKSLYHLHKANEYRPQMEPPMASASTKGNGLGRLKFLPLPFSTTLT